MFRLFSPFSQSGRFALLIVINLILSGGSSAQDHPRDHERRGPVLVLPADGSTVGPQVTVRIGFAGGGPRGPSEGTGINDAPPPPDGAPPPPPEGLPHGPSDGTGLGPPDHRHGPHFVLLVDQPALESGTPFHADAQHLTFPAGLPQMTVSLPPGQHRLLLQTLDHDGNIIQRHPPEAITVTVK
jgi:hypothetical protein